MSVSKLAPRLVSVLVRGDALDGFRIEAPTSHVKVFLPADGQDEPAVRTYTPVRFDEATKTLELQIVLHGTGPASEWAERAAPGDKDDRGLLPGSMVTRGYWRLGEANHPDHDYGDDEPAG